MVASAFGLVACGGGIEGDDFCPASGSQSTTVLILDTSDPLQDHQLARLERFADALVRSGRSDSGSAYHVTKGNLLIVYELPEAGEKPDEMFRMCNPGDPEDRRWWERFFEGAFIAKLRWSEFNEAMKQAFPMEAGLPPARTSPIIETIRYVRNREFDRASDGGPTQGAVGTILVISDMLQNSVLVSHYRLPLAPVEGLPQSLALDLRGIDVGLRYLRSQRDAHLQTGEHFAWWRSFLAEAGAPMSRPPESW